MKYVKLISLTIIFLAFISCNPTGNDKEKLLPEHNNSALKQQQTVDSSQDSLEFLKTLNGKYPNEVKLFDNAALAKRLQKLLGDRYNFFKEKFVVESPIKVKDNLFIASACQEHNCGPTNFLMVFDFLKNVIYVGIREDNKVKTYSEDGSNSQQLIDWAKN